MIIQCPACHTKFSVDETQMRSVDNPRFHCSRCDHYFEHSGEPSDATTNPPFGTASDIPRGFALPNAAHAKQLDLLPSSQTIRTSGSAFNFDLESEIPSRAPASSEVEAPLTAAWPDPLGTQALEVDMSSVVESVRKDSDLEFDFLKRPRPIIGASAPTERLNAEKSSDVQFNQESGAADVLEFQKSPPSPPDPSPPPSMTMQIAANAPRTQSTPLSSAAFAVSTNAAPIQRTPPELLEFRRPSAPEVAPEENRRKARRKRKHGRPLSTQWGISLVQYVSPLMTVLAFPVLLAGLFWWWSSSPGSLPAVFSKLAKAFPSGEVHLPPSGLELVDLKSELVTLDTGKRIIQITGNVMNRSDQALKSILIEARAYDAQNSALETELVDYNNSLLSVDRLNSLQEDAIKSLQAKPAVIGHELKPQAKFPFRLVLTNSGEQAAWYSARVYGVGYATSELASARP